MNFFVAFCLNNILSLLIRVLSVLTCSAWLRAYVLAYLVGLHAYVSRAWRACALMCSRAYVVACLICLRAYVLGVLVCSLAWTAHVRTSHTFSMLACFMSLRAHMSYMLDELKYLTCLRIYVLLWHRLFYFFTFEKLIPKILI